MSRKFFCDFQVVSRDRILQLCMIEDYYIGNWPMIYHFMEEMEHDVLFVEDAHENTNIFLRIIGFFLLILCLLLHSVIAVVLTICEKRLSIR